MSFFDYPYYSFTKAHMSLIGIWPEQSKHARIIRLFTIHAIIMTVGGPMVAVIIRLIRLYSSRRDIHDCMHNIPFLLIGFGNVLTMQTCIQHFDKITLSFKNIEGHWEMFKSTSAVSVLNKYTECGRCIIVVYGIYCYVSIIIYMSIYLFPTILDFVNPLNETRPKDNMFNAEYGVNVDKYFWFILAFEYLVSIVIIVMTITFEIMYILLTVHACALFEVVGFNLKLCTYKYMANKDNKSTLRYEWNYKKICDCITAHKVAISFAELVESLYSGIVVIVLIITVCMIVFTGVEALINSKYPHTVIQLAGFTMAQVFSLFFNCIPGQEFINHSRQIHTIVYELNWQDMSVKTQKLLILVMLRSNKPCCISAEKFFIVSMETFASTIRAVTSYFMLFVQLIQ